MENPYIYDPSNPKLVAKVNRAAVNYNNQNTYYLTGAIYAASVITFQRRYVRTNTATAAQTGAFLLLSLPTAWAYARYLTNSAENEAAVMNNDAENAL